MQIGLDLQSTSEKYQEISKTKWSSKQKKPIL